MVDMYVCAIRSEFGSIGLGETCLCRVNTQTHSMAHISLVRQLLSRGTLSFRVGVVQEPRLGLFNELEDAVGDLGKSRIFALALALSHTCFLPRATHFLSRGTSSLSGFLSGCHFNCRNLLPKRPFSLPASLGHHPPEGLLTLCHFHSLSTNPGKTHMMQQQPWPG